MGNIRFSENVVFREEPEGGMLFNVDTGELKLVEDVAWGICSMIEEGAGRSGMLRKLQELYPDEEDLEEDLGAFISELAESNFLAEEE